MSETAEGAARKTGGMGLGYLTGLDGLRALAVAAVLVYHADPGWLPGGFLGVEVFFVISGYLITALLLAEWRERGRIDVPRFWLRRARRLLPAVFLMIAVTLAFVVLFLPEEVAELRGDTLAALGYATNWYLIFGQESYFEAVGRPSLLRHLWSLAIEEQFYLLWPLVLAVVLGFGARRWRRGRVLFLAVAGATVSTGLMALLYQPGVDPSRLYYGTDTRAAALLIGAALALLWVPAAGSSPKSAIRFAILDRLSRPGGWTTRLRRRWGWTSPLLLNGAGLVALTGLFCFFILLNEYRPFLYRGGFAAVSLTTATLIAVVVHPRAYSGPLEWGPLRWIGVRSYGIYLWHWPIYMVTRPQLDVSLEPLPLFALRIAATVILADLSYRYVETPIRRGALERAWRSLRESDGPRKGELATRWAISAVAVIAFSSSLGTAIVLAEPPEKPSYLAKNEIHTRSSSANPEKPTEDDKPANDRASRGPSEAGSVQANKAELETGSGKEQKASEDSRASDKPVGRVTAVGDSVMLGAAPQLEKRIDALETIDAEVGMYPADAIEILRQRRAAGQLGDVVVVHVGENGPFSAEEFDEMIKILKGRRVVFVNVKVPRAWERPNNAMLARKVKEYPNTILVDWYSASSGRYDLFWDDGIHLRPEGASFYADLISDHLKSRS